MGPIQDYKAADYISVAKEYLENRSELNAMDQESPEEEIEVVDEIMSDREKAKRDKVADSLKKRMIGQYGKERGEQIAYATATKQVQGVGGGKKRRDED